VHITRGRKRKVRIFEPSRGFDTPLTRPLKNAPFLYQPRVPMLLGYLSARTLTLVVGLRKRGELQSSRDGRDILTFRRGSNERREVIRSLTD
jgi:hypothetical protein